jgi:hypothetical protein
MRKSFMFLQADCGERIMESETIQKNGASLKSLTSKGNNKCF